MDPNSVRIHHEYDYFDTRSHKWKVVHVLGAQLTIFGTEFTIRINQTNLTTKVPADELHYHDESRFPSAVPIVEPEWVLCKDTDYWSKDPHIITLVRVEANDDDETYIYTKDTCPYGWGVLVKMFAEMTNIKIG